MLEIVSSHRNVDDADKTSFLRWHPNPAGKKVTQANYEKTLIHFGRKEADERREANISSSWTAEE